MVLELGSLLRELSQLGHRQRSREDAEVVHEVADFSNRRLSCPADSDRSVRSIRFLKFDPCLRQSVLMRFLASFAPRPFRRRVGASHEITTEKEVPRGLCAPIRLCRLVALIIALADREGTSFCIAMMSTTYCYFIAVVLSKNERGGGSVLYNRRELVSGECALRLNSHGTGASLFRERCVRWLTQLGHRLQRCCRDA